MKLTIIKDDGAVYKDGLSYSNLSLPTLPSDVHALQWNNDKGHIEFVDNIKPNEEITELPSWANDALVAWQDYADLLEKQKQEQEQLNQAQPTTNGTQEI
jgi:hypothetical protein